MTNVENPLRTNPIENMWTMRLIYLHTEETMIDDIFFSSIFGCL